MGLPRSVGEIGGRGQVVKKWGKMGQKWAFLSCLIKLYYTRQKTEKSTKKSKIKAYE